MMVKHLVMWKLKETAEGGEKEQNAQRIKELLEGLRGRIPGLISIEVGINVNKSQMAYDVALYTEFESLEALEVYQNHPEHLNAARFVRAVNEGRVVVDYEI
jgi:heme-degrading monooxygenase HmoA